jgi:ABC-type branched-subunit amino acid transport system ATPase component
VAEGDSGALLEVRNLRKVYGAATVLHGVSMQLREHEVLALLGDNGAAVAKLRGEPVKRKINTGTQLIESDNAERYFERVRHRLGGTGRGLEG